jgi:CRISPR-associated endonuclease/helicase Cas3
MANLPSEHASWANYWGKAKPDEQQQARWHPLVCHCLDVAASGAEILQVDHRLRANFERLSGCSADQLLPWIYFFLALHDLGKFSVPFQQQVPDLLEELQGPMPTFPSEIRHDRLGYWFYSCRFASWFVKRCRDRLRLGGKPISESSLDLWWSAVTGHHGRPPDGAPDEFTIQRGFGSAGADAAEQFAEDFLSILDPPLLDLAGKDAVKTMSWLLAGLAILADWLGSNQDHFPYRGHAPPADLSSLRAYWSLTRQQARAVVEFAGLLPVVSAPGCSFEHLFPHAVPPSPLQALCARVPLAAEPQIFLIEDATGAGKTEAALMLVHRLIKAGLADGFYMAMPTMATANGMYPRVAGVLPKLFSSTPSLVLAHSSARLSQQLQRHEEKGLAGLIQENPARAAEATDGDARGDTATRHASAWLSDSSKKALLASVGVGTLDQALLAALPANHSPLRLLGLHRKVLVVDEVHACDIYMSTILDRVLEFHAMLGGSVILLSATLSMSQRERLLQAFLGKAVQLESPDAHAFPSLVQASREALHVEPVDASTRSRRHVDVNLLDDGEKVRAFLLEKAAAGGCVAWVRNTVADAIKAHDQLLEAARAQGKQIEVLLFHARFALGHRLEIEEQVLRRFGRESTPETRARTLLVATQVIEQSLDLDFDELVSDLAPVDLLIQRAGRFRRHTRDASGTCIKGADQRAPSGFQVLIPPWTETPEPGWLSGSELERTALVYPAIAHLWRTVRLLRERQALRVPEEARALVEGVYGPEALTPPSLENPQFLYEGKELAQESIAQFAALKPDSGYRRGLDGAWQDDTVVRTRLGEESCRVRLAVEEEGKLRPLVEAPGQPWWVSWALSEVSVRTNLLAAENPGDATLIEAAKKQMSDEGRFVVLVVLRREGDLFEGTALAKRGRALRPMRVTYSRQNGLQATERKGT